MSQAIHTPTGAPTHTPTPSHSHARKLDGAKLLGATAISAIALLWLVPVWVTLLAALKSGEEFSATSLFALPSQIEWHNFGVLFGAINIGEKIVNSFVISGGAMLLSLLIALPVAYAVAVGRHRLGPAVIAVSVLIFLLPLESVAYPIYLLSKQLGLYGERAFVIAPLGIIGAAFGVFLLSNVMRHLPRELIEAAELDGATKLSLLTRIVFPLLLPTVLVVGLLLFVSNWNEYLISLLLLPETSTQTVPLAVSMVNYGQFGGAPGQLVAAASLLAALPSLLVFLLFQRALVRGITAGIQ